MRTAPAPPCGSARKAGRNLRPTATRSWSRTTAPWRSTRCVPRPALRSAEGFRAAWPGRVNSGGADGQPSGAGQFADRADRARQEGPGQLTHASGGSATLLALELFKAMAGIDIRSIPYRGGAPAVTGTISGETSMIIADLTTGNAGLQSTACDRSPSPASKGRRSTRTCRRSMEAGVKGYEVNTWIEYFAPAGTPKDAAAAIEVRDQGSGRSAGGPCPLRDHRRGGAFSGSADECGNCWPSMSPNGPSSCGTRASSSRLSGRATAKVQCLLSVDRWPPSRWRRLRWRICRGRSRYEFFVQQVLRFYRPRAVMLNRQ